MWTISEKIYYLFIYKKNAVLIMKTLIKTHDVSASTFKIDELWIQFSNLINWQYRNIHLLFVDF